MAVVDVARRVNRFEVPGAQLLSLGGIHGDGFDPMKGVLELEKARRGQGEDNLVGEERIARGRSYIQKEGAFFFEKTMHFPGPVAAPKEIGVAILVVLVTTVVDAEIVGRRGHDDIDGPVVQFAHSCETVLMMKVNSGRHG